ncbi:10473_t:CDS:2 [Funneliformis mosseae]|uniref:10473_t:CDS:1 n=1 Tax=Funneliformis mosseae TaxID=27381 RepID=A0A9N9FYP0_FUNMO|nr:10473_t:CDS:2 [Funneliformis mosseae]
MVNLIKKFDRYVQIYGKKCWTQKLYASSTTIIQMISEERN